MGTSFDKLEMESKELGHLFAHHLRQSYNRSFTTLTLLFLGDEDLIDQHAQKACELAVCDDA